MTHVITICYTDGLLQAQQAMQELDHLLPSVL